MLNATGPWVDHLRRMEDPNAAPSIRLSKGAHLVLKRTAPWKAALATPIDKYRITFALPWEDMLLLGTTDEEYEGDPADVAVNDKDVTQILDEAAFSIRDQQLSRDLITYSFAGLRVLPGGPGDTSKAKRETVVTEGTRRHAVGGRRQVDDLPPHRPYGDEQAGRRCPGSRWPRTWSRSRGCRRSSRCPVSPTRTRSRTGCWSTAARPGPRMAADTARHLATHYGSLSFDIARLANDDPALGERIHPDAPEIWAQVVYARDHEWAETADDVLRRRTTLTIRGLATDEIRGKVEDLLGKKA